MKCQCTGSDTQRAPSKGQLRCFLFGLLLRCWNCHRVLLGEGWFLLKQHLTATCLERPLVERIKHFQRFCLKR